MQDHQDETIVLRHELDILVQEKNKLVGKNHVTKNIDIRQVHKLVAHVRNIVAMSNVMIERQKAMREHMQNELMLRNTEEDLQSKRESIKKSIRVMEEFGVTLTGNLLFIRSLQDACCGILKEILLDVRGSWKNNNDSMYQYGYKKETGEIFKEVKKRIPDYFDWFERVRNIRNELKAGRTMSGGYEIANDIHINFSLFDRDTEGNIIIGKGEAQNINLIIESVRMSIKLIELITNKMDD